MHTEYSVFVAVLLIHNSLAHLSTGVYSYEAGDITKLNDKKTSISIGIFCASYALCDIIIALCMTYHLMRSNTGFRRTQVLVTKIIRLTIETGSMTAFVALAVMVLLFAFPHQIFFVTPALVISKMCANSMYMVLNSRIRIMGGRVTYTSSTDMEITTTMMRDITSTQGAQSTPVVAMIAEVFSSDDELSRMSYQVHTRARERWFGHGEFGVLLNMFVRYFDERQRTTELQSGCITDVLKRFNAFDRSRIRPWREGGNDP
ncbi:hypothetical protein IW261DRAFT_1598863 [Armillaria novae-zelandiae]|uniref:DUF6534 domain-containing protein n=1 Tax=Armillaria novae-zelandiae TaxID=153914 RepID=A0AA39T488_9AGAR|nr:hypothetical protein IW261DRAFT_1598863 [Armillaria novae-zelandiae]